MCTEEKGNVSITIERGCLMLFSCSASTEVGRVLTQPPAEHNVHNAIFFSSFSSSLLNVI